MLTSVLAKAEVADAASIAEAAETAFALHDPSTMSWSKQAAWERGSFSTFLRVDWDEDERVLSVCCVGDTLFVMGRSGHRPRSIPYDSSAEFALPPVLVSTLMSHNGFLSEKGSPSVQRESWRFGSSDSALLLCVTDALGAWLLEDVDGLEKKMAELADWDDPERFSDFVESERQAGRMRRDDVTLVVAHITPVAS